MYIKFEDSGSKSRREVCDGFRMRKKETGQIKKNGKNEDADSLLHNTTSHMFFTKFRNPR